MFLNIGLILLYDYDIIWGLQFVIFNNFHAEKKLKYIVDYRGVPALVTGEASTGTPCDGELLPRPYCIKVNDITFVLCLLLFSDFDIFKF